LIICDTSGLYAAYNSKQRGHRATLGAVENDPGPLVVSPYVLTELDCLLRIRMGVDAEVRMLRDVEAGAYDVIGLSDAEIGQAVSLIDRYADRNLGLADAANVVLASRFRTTNLLTLDERGYRIVRPLWGAAFTPLPADAPSRSRRR
jgi:uncharacterized protein